MPGQSIRSTEARPEALVVATSALIGEEEGIDVAVIINALRASFSHAC